MLRGDSSKFQDIKEIQVNWWDKDENFYLTEMINKQNTKNLRKLILSKMETFLKRRPKLSRLVLEVSQSKVDKALVKTSTQLGIVNWKCFFLCLLLCILIMDKIVKTQYMGLQ